MTLYNEDLYRWKENEAWYGIDEETGEYFLTDEAPDYAKESYSLLMEQKSQRL
jgi:hypothetical protein